MSIKDKNNNLLNLCILLFEENLPMVFSLACSNVSLCKFVALMTTIYEICIVVRWLKCLLVYFFTCLPATQKE